MLKLNPERAYRDRRETLPTTARVCYVPGFVRAVSRAAAHGGSSNGRTADSDSASLGSNPSPPANLFNEMEPTSGRQSSACRHHVGAASKIGWSTCTNEPGSRPRTGTKPDRGLAGCRARPTAKRPIGSPPISGRQVKRDRRRLGYRSLVGFVFSGTALCTPAVGSERKRNDFSD
jgi:hypothetical protein